MVLTASTGAPMWNMPACTLAIQLRNLIAPSPNDPLQFRNLPRHHCEHALQLTVLSTQCRILGPQPGVLRPQRGILHSKTLIRREVGDDDTLPDSSNRSTRHAEDHATPAPPTTTAPA